MKKLLALLLALAMLMALCACGGKDKDDKDDVTGDPEAVAEAYAKASPEEDYAAIFDLHVVDIEQTMKDEVTDYYDSEEDFFAQASEEYDTTIDSWKDVYAAMLKNEKANLEEIYGQYLIKTEVTDSVELDEDELAEAKEELLDEWEDYVDKDKVQDVTKAMNVTVKITVDGEKEDSTRTMVATVFKYDGEWKVALTEMIEKQEAAGDKDASAEDER